MHLRYRVAQNTTLAGDFEPVIKLWILRILIPLNGSREFLQEHDFSNDSIVKMLAMDELDALRENGYTKQAARKLLHELYNKAEKELASATAPSVLDRNVKQISALVGLSAADERILEFVALIHNEQILDDTADLLGNLSTVKVCYSLSVLLDIPENEVRLALRSNGTLSKSGLVTIDRTGSSYLRAKLDVLSDSFVDQIFSNDAEPVSLLRSIVAESSAPVLKIDDYEHIRNDLAVLRPYLRRSIDEGRAGVNIFLFGKPGTGKSQLVKVLAHEFGTELFEITSEDDDGDPINGDRRLRAFRAAQNFFVKRNTLLVFDEAEDVFDDGDTIWGRKSTAQTRKAWVNKMLEENTVPTFWLSNTIQGLDPAFIRRFDMMIELPVPHKKQRLKIINEACGDIIDMASINRVAASDALAPAVITRAAEVIRSIKKDLDSEDVSLAFERIVNNTLASQGHKPIKRNDPNHLPDVYDPDIIQADTNITQVADGLMQSKAGRLCLYGPPGTGKTAYGRWLAEQMNVPLLVKRGSDLINKWVGGTEQNIAAAFKEAESEGALLLLDEVDGFLQDRRSAKNSWEVTGVNELLTQMESFSGVLVASTNLIDGLDQAALRRFDLKVKFEYLKAEQSWILVNRYCKVLGIDKPDENLKTNINGLINLTPGDFAAVARRHRFQPIRSALTLINNLESECFVKEGVKRSIGFVH